ncbi:MAG: hypothetical protein NTU89_00645, partial [Candidatus Dependentiae bacterium]|nr:hypothetical protein [Candidatus Dependentiae bacterium]
ESQRAMQSRDEMMKSLQLREYQNTLDLHKRYPELLHTIATEETIRALGIFIINPSNPPTAQVKIISDLIERNEDFCSLLLGNSCKILCEFANKNPQKNIDLLKKLTKFTRNKNTLNTYRALCSIITNPILPKKLIDELLEQIDYASESPRRPNRLNIHQHQAATYLTQPPYLELNLNALTLQDPHILSIILHYSSPDRCIQKVKQALAKVAGISKETLECAKFYNPKCLLFLLQYKSWFPKFYQGLFSIHDYSQIVTAYNYFMIKNDPTYLIDILSPSEQRVLNPLTIKVRACFSNERPINKMNCSYIEERNRTFLYQELLPTLQNLQNSSTIKTYEDTFIEAIIEKNHAKISEMMQIYTPNHYYVGNHYHEYYGTPPLFIAIALHDPIATNLLLEKISPRKLLAPAWHPNHSAAYFALRACMSRYNQYITSIKEIAELNNILKSEQITEISNPKTIFDLDEAISCQAHVKKHNLKANSPFIEIEENIYKKSLETLKIVLDFTNFQELEKSDKPSGQTIAQYALETVTLFIKSINNTGTTSNQRVAHNQQGQDRDADSETTTIYGTEILETLFDFGISPDECISPNLPLEKFAIDHGLPLMADYIKQYKEIHKAT